MAQVSITINGRSYLVACDDGQEDHLQALGAYVDEKVREMIPQAGPAGPVGGSRLLVLASLVLADELFEAERELATGQERSVGRVSPADAKEGRDNEAAAVLEGCARQIGDLAASLEEA